MLTFFLITLMIINLGLTYLVADGNADYNDPISKIIFATILSFLIDIGVIYLVIKIVLIDLIIGGIVVNAPILTAPLLTYLILVEVIHLILALRKMNE